MSFTPLFRKLQQEGHITRSCLATGLTEIRNADIGDRGRYYTGFFQLAIGVERTAKLAIIINHLAENDLESPGEKAVRSFGHRVDDLHEAAAKIAKQRQYEFASQFDLADLEQEILSFLTRFADEIRYSNLDALAKGSAEPKPLAQWSKILDTIIEEDVSQSKIDKIRQESFGMAQAFGEAFFVQVHDLEDKPLTVESWMSQPRLHEEAARHAIWHIALLIHPLMELVEELAREAMSVDKASDRKGASIPHMSEFYTFLWFNRQHILSKKKWP